MDVETETHSRLGVLVDVIETEEKMLRLRLFRESRYSLGGIHLFCIYLISFVC